MIFILPTWIGTRVKLAGANTEKRVKVAFKVGTAPNLTGDNIPRISEPGVRATATGSAPAIGPQPADPAPSVAPANDEETSDFLQQGYQ
jgi:hypothetical protein